MKKEVVGVDYTIGKEDLKLVVTKMGAMLETSLLRPIWAQNPAKPFAKKLKKTLGMKKKK